MSWDTWLDSITKWLEPIAIRRSMSTSIWWQSVTLLNTTSCRIQCRATTDSRMTWVQSCTIYPTVEPRFSFVSDGSLRSDSILECDDSEGQSTSVPDGSTVFSLLLDSKLANLGYHCADKCQPRIVCENEGYATQFCRFSCPDGFSGDRCELLQGYSGRHTQSVFKSLDMTPRSSRIQTDSIGEITA